MYAIRSYYASDIERLATPLVTVMFVNRRQNSDGSWSWRRFDNKIDRAAFGNFGFRFRLLTEHGARRSAGGLFRYRAKFKLLLFQSRFRRFQ